MQMTILHDVCIIGVGPAGITAAIELAERGLTVVLVESGTENYDKATQHLSDAKIVTQSSHSAMSEAVNRGLGGTSVLWGGRCVPLDAVDFEYRDFVNDSGWILKTEDIAPYYARACEILGVGDASFDVASCSALETDYLTLSAKFSDTGSIRATQLERWSRKTNLWQAHKDKITANSLITILPESTCIGFRQAQLDDSVTEVLVRSTLAAQSDVKLIKARIYVIACGGVESTRLILNSLRDPLGLKLHSSELVGRYYMGHPSGKISDIELFGNPTETLFGFERDGDVYVRRRITLQPDVLRNEKLLNIAFWLDNATLSDCRHGSGILSAAYLALTTPILCRLLAPAAIRKRIVGEHAQQRMNHILNCLRSPLQTLLFCVGFIRQRYFATPRLPGFFTYSANNRYALHYHAEQIPNWDSMITLSDEADAHGLLRAQIALEWSEQDINSIIRAHEVLDQALQKDGIGRLIYRIPTKNLKQSIREQAVDGFHQLGTLRMADTPANGVTDAYGRVYGVSNLYIASSAIFPTSGQANPTLTMVALTIRQAEKIAKDLSDA